jgi:hypothetical protein
MGDVIPFPRDVVSTQIGDALTLADSGMNLPVYVREDDDNNGALVVDIPIFPGDPNMPIPAMFCPTWSP